MSKYKNYLLNKPLLNLNILLILHANWMSFSNTVTSFAWTVHKLDCSNNPTRKASPTSWSAMMAMLWKCRSALMFWVISLTTLWNGSLLINKSVLFLYFLISFNTFIPLLMPFPVFSFIVFPSCLSMSFSLSVPLLFLILFSIFLTHPLFTLFYCCPCSLGGWLFLLFLVPLWSKLF